MKANATARVMVEVRNLGSWGDECTIEQVKKQAEDAVKSRLVHALQKASADLISTIDVKITLED